MSWPKVRLGDVCEVKAGRDYKDVESPDGKYPIYGTGGVMGMSREWRCPAGSVIVGRKGTLDNPMLINEPFWNIDTCFGVVPSGKLLPAYLWRFCQNFDFYSLVPASGRPSTTSDAVKAINLPLPPLAEQKKIVEKVEKALKRVDALKAQFERMEKSAADYFKAALAETFAAVKGEKVSLENLCELIVDCPHTTAPDEGVGYPLVRTPNIGFGRLVYENMHRVSKAVYDARNARAVPRASDLVFAREAPAGNIAVLQNGEEVCLGQRTVLLRPKMDIVRPDFLAVVVLSPASQKKLLGKSFGATVQHVNVKDIRRFEVIVPALKCQDDVVCRVFAAKLKSERMVAAARRGIEICGKMRKAILAEAFQ